MRDDDRHSNCLTPEDLLLLHYGELDERQVAALPAHLSACAECTARQTELRRTLSTFESLNVQAPDEERLEQMMRLAVHHPPSRTATRSSTSVSWWTVAAAVVLAGVAGFYVLRLAPLSRQGPVTSLGDQPPAPVRRVVLQAPSASDRLRMVVEGARLRNPREEMLNDLIEMLRTDPSVNVRLAVIDSLRVHPDSRKHQDRLIAALADQPPLTRKAVIELLVALDLRSAQPALREVARHDPSTAVRVHARWALEELS